MKKFIDEKATDFEQLEVKYKQGQNPRLVLVGADGTSETVPIGGWNVETVVEYLQENLGTAAAVAA